MNDETIRTKALSFTKIAMKPIPVVSSMQRQHRLLLRTDRLLTARVSNLFSFDLVSLIPSDIFVV